jgi:broad specificity phosphatase PhoE
MTTTLILLRHAATAANLERPARLQGRRLDLPLAPLGIRQAELTRNLLAMRPFNRIIASPLRRAMQTAEIIAFPRRRAIETVAELIECDVGHWEGMSWEDIHRQDREAYLRFHQNPAAHGYPGGESFSDVAQRVVPFFSKLVEDSAGQTLLVVSHHLVNRVYLANLLGLPPEKARLVKLDNCGISVVVHHGTHTQVVTLNAAFHLQGLGAAA